MSREQHKGVGRKLSMSVLQIKVDKSRNRMLTKNMTKLNFSLLLFILINKRNTYKKKIMGHEILVR